mgnify:CR=1 FL=1
MRASGLDLKYPGIKISTFRDRLVGMAYIPELVPLDKKLWCTVNSERFPDFLEGFQFMKSFFAEMGDINEAANRA